MSTTAGSQAKSPAPWKADFLSHISKMPSPDRPRGLTNPYIPRARYCIFRGMWAELPENKHNEAPMNDHVYESEMPTFTSDVRMEKIPQLFASSAGHAESVEQAQGSGGGGPVEAVWWVKETGTQWRIKGKAFVVGPDIEDAEESSGVRTVKSEVGKGMRCVKEEGKEGWSWKRELTAQFGNNSPGLRGTFRAPPPGRPKSEPYDDKELELGTKVEDLNDPVARKNFRVVIIKPEEVEATDISDPATARRHRYTYVGKDGEEWKMEETWP
ncbi:hypothetical protein H2199_003586 [Coniosporium tulheliwenetii]|uniref:Uncharacterized protein n=1 Tax=Coniosporium tulheliwenetii TaxID=3383036 RepID=A0ACC2ZA43_9PEZI|nr:hypothetical protein H2199_003586 [Cladosporium sp. JES 115]